MLILTQFVTVMGLPIFWGEIISDRYIYVLKPPKNDPNIMGNNFLFKQILSGEVFEKKYVYLDFCLN